MNALADKADAGGRPMTQAEWSEFYQAHSATASAAFHLYAITNQSIAVPEPSTLLLAAFSLVGLAAWGWRRRKR